VSLTGAVVSEEGEPTDRTVHLAIEKLGGGVGAVSWRVLAEDGITAADFESGNLPGGRFDFNDSGTGISFGFRVADDGIAEGTETMKIELFDPEGGVLGWSDTVQVKLEEGHVASYSGHSRQ
jgi:hypothetical protein